MLKGLEISVVKLSEVLKENTDFRIHSEYFKKDSYFKMNSKYEYKQIGDFATVADGDHSKFPENQSQDFVYLQAKDIKNNFVNVSENPVMVGKEYFYKNKRSHIFGENILLSIMGNVGDIAITPKDFKPTICNRAVAIIKNIKGVNPYYVFAYLITNSAFKQINRIKNGGVQERINLDILEKFLIPILPQSFQKEIERIVKSAHSLLEQSKKDYKDAENLLLKSLGIQGDSVEQKVSESRINCNIKKLSQSFMQTGRLDAEYYQSKYDIIEEKIKSFNGGYKLINELFTQRTETAKLAKSSYNYIEIGDINVSDGSATFNNILVEDLPANAKTFVQKGDLLISKVRPYRGAVSIIDFDDSDLIASGAFTVLVEKDNSEIKKEVLQVILRTSTFKDWLLKWNVGSSYPVIKDEDILNLPIPLLPLSTQEKIASLVQSSFAKKAQSKALLQRAKLMVEEEIEK